MKKTFLLVIFSVATLLASIGDDQTNNSLTQPNTSTPLDGSKWYYGGNLGFNFWNDYLLISVEPMVGYNISPKFSVGGKLQYSYIKDSRSDYGDATSHNYGASIFSRFRPVPPVYFHAEFAYGSYESHTYFTNPIRIESERNWVPFLLFGGGYVQQISPNASVYAEVLFDVLRDKNSPYKDWDPIIHVGAGIGF